MHGERVPFCLKCNVNVIVEVHATFQVSSLEVQASSFTDNVAKLSNTAGAAVAQQCSSNQDKHNTIVLIQL